jgi:hypothetical protein
MRAKLVPAAITQPLHRDYPPLAHAMHTTDAILLGLCIALHCRCCDRHTFGVNYLSSALLPDIPQAANSAYTTDGSSAELEQFAALQLL